MTKHWLVALVVAPLAGPAIAADMPVKAPPPAPAAVFSWTGCYIGGNVGAAFNNSDIVLSPSGGFLAPGFVAFNPLRTDSFDFSDAALTGGGQIGCNWQTARWVFGLEADIQAAGISESIALTRTLAAPLVGTISHTVSHDITWWGTVRGRVGWAANAWLFYATGGLAYAHVESAASTRFSGAGDLYAGSASDTRLGWTVGGGVEWGFAPRWSAKVEYLYVDVGSFSYVMPNVPPPAFPTLSYTADVDTAFHVARLGVNFRF
jgi:outer membrane immunogenic protein